jgi:hypothetical protein
MARMRGAIETAAAQANWRGMPASASRPSGIMEDNLVRRSIMAGVERED